MKKTESLEDYLKAIYTLSLEKKTVRAIDIAKHFSFSRPTVSVALKQYKNDGYLTIDDYAIHLTDKGMEIAMSVFERHEVIEQVLIKSVLIKIPRITTRIWWSTISAIKALKRSTKPQRNC